MPRLHASILFLLLVSLGPLAGCEGDPAGPAIGSLRVTVSTLGEFLTPPNFTVAVTGPGDAERILVREIPGNGSVVFEDLEAARYTVELNGLEELCEVTGSNPRTVRVHQEATTETRFDVVCRDFTQG